jgi:hypothetical protein
MTKRFKLTPDLTCPELNGYKLPEMQGKPIAIEVEWIESWIGAEFDEPDTNEDGTVKGKWVYE